MPLVITEDIHSPPKIVIMTAEVTVPRTIKAPGGIRVATCPTQMVCTSMERMITRGSFGEHGKITTTLSRDLR